MKAGKAARQARSAEDSAPFVHPQGIVEPGARVGARTRVWAFVHILPGAVIGEDCNLCDQVFIENDVRVGDRVTVKSGVHLWDGITLEEDVFVGPGVAFTNDVFPRSKEYPDRFLRTRVCTGASLGANATILPGKTIGRYAMIGAGAVITQDVPPYAIVAGNPGRVVGFVDASRQRAVAPVSGAGEELNAREVKLVSIPTVQQPRGDLSVAEVEAQLPFTPRRYFAVYAVPPHEVRGGHAHRTQLQFLTCLHGSCHVLVDDGSARDEIRLSSPEVGLYLPAGIWAVQYKYTPDAVLLVLTSGLYDADDYIRDYEEFLALKGKTE